VVIGPGPRAYFGDLESNFYALDANTGKLLWQKKLDNQPFTRITGTVKLHDGRLYVPIASQEENAGANPQYSCCTFRGNLVVVKASDGSIVWRTYTTPEAKPTRKTAAGVQYYGPSGATIWSSPTLDLKRKLVYVAAGNGYSGPDIKTADAVIAMEMETGKIKWSRQTAPDMFNWGCGARGPDKGNCPENAGTDVDLGGSPILMEIGGGKQMLVQGQKSAEVHGLDPAQEGKILWSTRIGVGGAGGGIQWGIAAGDGLVFAGLGESPRGAQAATASTGLFAIDPATGKIVWHTPAPVPSCAGQRGCSVSQKSPPSAIPGVVFSPSMDGHVRAHETKTGKIIWDFDTAREFPTVNGIPGKGGSMAGTGATIADGMLYVNSGYSSMAGNVLLAFGVK
jgi:polyvinyl alcohol dehydrogenase (cytochrome)